MVELTALWLPVLLSAVAVFVVSSVVHMATPWHKRDQSALPDEDTVLDALRAANPPRGHYRFPFAASMGDMGSDEMKAKFARGPIGVLTVGPGHEGGGPLGQALITWFLYSLLVSLVAAYTTGLTVPAGADFGLVLRVTSSIAALAYCTSTFHESIWKGVPWSVALRFVVDGLLYALATGAVFAWAWPGA